MKSIAIVGIDGSGKSTLISGLTHKLKNPHVISIWDTFRAPDLSENFTFKNKEAIDQYLTQLSPNARSLFLFHSLYEAYQRALREDDKTYIFDGHWYKYASSQIESGSDPDLIQALSKLFPIPSLVILLETKAQIAVERREYFSSAECGFLSRNNKQGFIEFQNRCLARLKVLTRDRIVLTIPEGLSIEETLQRSISFIEGYIK